MLNELIVEGLGVIERAELTLAPGCCALTGETGTGKTLLVAAVGLLLGDRADKRLVREGVSDARVEGRFALEDGQGATAFLVERGLMDGSGEAGEVVISRTVSATGHSRARINGRMVPISTLSELGPLLVEIASQHEHQRLADPGYQRGLLDSFAGEDTVALAGTVGLRVAAAKRSRKELDDLRSGEKDRAIELETLRREVAEITAAAPSEGEVERLEADALRLEHADAIASAAGDANQAIATEGGVVERLASARSALERIEGKDPNADELARRLEATIAELNDIATELRTLQPSVDPAELGSVRERLGALSRLRRRFGGDDAAVLAHLERSSARLTELEAADSNEEELKTRLEAEEAAARSAADELSARRAKAAAGLEKEASKLLHELAMKDAHLAVTLSPVDLGEGGLERVALELRFEGGSRSLPVSDAASGGELSRVYLALHLLTRAVGASTLVFDEVDAGIGGEVARSVGGALARLARGGGAQVLVVTHLPQVAAFADAHYVVTKETGRGLAGASVQQVDGEDRIGELSRMLAGLPESESAREHAVELLEHARAGT